MRKGLIEWYHEALTHSGITRMEESVLCDFTWPNCTKDIAEFVKTCTTCQKKQKYEEKKSAH